MRSKVGIMAAIASMLSPQFMSNESRSARRPVKKKQELGFTKKEWLQRKKRQKIARQSRKVNRRHAR